MSNSNRPHVVLLAAENGAIPGGKVGGIADVISEIPAALADAGVDVTVLTPSHGFLHKLPAAQKTRSFDFGFGGHHQSADLYELQEALTTNRVSKKPTPGNPCRGHVTQLVIDHPIIATDAPGLLYQTDSSDRPFARDATRFACFSSACASLIEQGLDKKVDVIHLHDWHSGFLAILRNSGNFPVLASIRTVFTIHNLAYQGIRPMSDDESSLLAWYPQIDPNRETLGDPRWPWCVNPLAAAIRLADALHVVSPTYANDIQKPDKPELGPGTGGCGLEQLLIDAKSERRLFGILNGCDYQYDEPGIDPWQRIPWSALKETLQQSIKALDSSSQSKSMRRAASVLAMTADTGPAPIVTSIGRLTDQKVGLLVESVDDDSLAIDALLRSLGNQALLVMLGSGDPVIEETLQAVAERHDNFLLILGFSEQLADALYRGGDLFLMPSTFEPCGLSQILAMRAGQPCLVHSVGGLKDTVTPGVNGFAFTADTRGAQANALVTCANKSFQRYNSDTYPDWKRLCEAAKSTRFEWKSTIEAYLRHLYSPAINVEQLKT